jgi:hypothetical protein
MLREMPILLVFDFALYDWKKCVELVFFALRMAALGLGSVITIRSSCFHATKAPSGHSAVSKSDDAMSECCGAVGAGDGPALQFSTILAIA